MSTRCLVTGHGPGGKSRVVDDQSVEPVGLVAGAAVVQNGTRHAWRNAGDTPATLVNVSLGIKR